VFGLAWRISIKFDEIKGKFKPRFCIQCPEAWCISACPLDAIKREDSGALVILEEICSRCGLCIDVCPYEAIAQENSGSIVLCDLCAGNPKCAEVCPTGAIKV